MTPSGFTTALHADRSPADCFAAVTDPRAWWSTDIDGPCQHVGDEFTFCVPGVHTSRLRVTGSVPGRRLTWLVLENRMSYVADQTEWVGTSIVFDFVADGTGTEVRFTHAGLVPSYECYDTCSAAWTSLVHDSLRDLLHTGTGAPYRPSAATASS